jgi:hypothetical protein
MSHLIEYNVYINKTYISFKIVKKKILNNLSQYWHNEIYEKFILFPC